MKLVLSMAAAIVSVATAPDPSVAMIEAKADLKTAAEACAPGDLPPGTARWYQRTAAALGQHGGLKAKCWALMQKWKPWVREAA